jgi:hypothetical protein
LPSVVAASDREAETVSTTTPQASPDGEVEVAHEALIRYWPRLREWLDQDRSALLLRESVREAAQEWEQHGRDESYLAHRGRRLAEAEALAHHPRFTLNAQEQAYVDAAISLREREEQEREAQQQRELGAARQLAEEAEARREAEAEARREAEQRVGEQAVAARRLQRRLMIAVGLGVFALLAAIGAFVFFRQAEADRIYAQLQEAAALNAAATAVAAASTAEAEQARADEQAQVSLIQALVAQAMSESELGEHERGALLARQAYLFDEAAGGPVRERVDAALRVALGVPHFTSVLRGHEGWVTAVAFSPDGTVLASVDDLGAVRLWRPAKPAAPVVLKGHAGKVFEAAFNADGTVLATAGEDGTVQLWDVANPAAAPAVLDGGVGRVYDAAFFPDRQTLISVARTWWCGSGTLPIPPPPRSSWRDSRAGTSTWPFPQMETFWPTAAATGLCGCGRSPIPPPRPSSWKGPRARLALWPSARTEPCWPRPAGADRCGCGTSPTPGPRPSSLRGTKAWASR